MTETRTAVLAPCAEAEIVRRRFGAEFPGRPCADPNVIECALWDCQVRDRCKQAAGA